MEFKIKPKSPKRIAKIIVIGPPGKKNTFLYTKKIHTNIKALEGQLFQKSLLKNTDLFTFRLQN